MVPCRQQYWFDPDFMDLQRRQHVLLHKSVGSPSWHHCTGMLQTLCKHVRQGDSPYLARSILPATCISNHHLLMITCCIVDYL